MVRMCVCVWVSECVSCAGNQVYNMDPATSDSRECNTTCSTTIQRGHNSRVVDNDGATSTSQTDTFPAVDNRVAGHEVPRHLIICRAMHATCQCGRHGDDNVLCSPTRVSGRHDTLPQYIVPTSRYTIVKERGSTVHCTVPIRLHTKVDGIDILALKWDGRTIVSDAFKVVVDDLVATIGP